MMFEFTTSPRILFGPGCRREIVNNAQESGNRYFLVTGRNLDRIRFLLDDFRKRGIDPVCFSVPGEPTLSVVMEGTALARAYGADCIIAVGGGSVIDAGKAIAAFLTNSGDPFDYLEVVGRGKPLVLPPYPVVAVPTTAGAGAEVTRNAVITIPEHRVKVSLRHRQMVPRTAIVDPELTMSLPSTVTASTGLDALTQLVEPFVSSGSNPMTDAYCREGIPRVARSIVQATETGTDGAAREEMALAALFGGIALANARLGAVHGFAGPIGGMFDAPHGMVCARLLPLVMQANLTELRIKENGRFFIERFAEIGRMLTGQSNAGAEEAVEWVRRTVDRLKVPPLSQWGVQREDIPEIVEKSKKASSMKGNPVTLPDVVLAQILSDALD